MFGVIVLTAAPVVFDEMWRPLLETVKIEQNLLIYLKVGEDSGLYECAKTFGLMFMKMIQFV